MKLYAIAAALFGGFILIANPASGRPEESTYHYKEVDYFLGMVTQGRSTEPLRRFKGEIRIGIFGNPSAADLQEVQKIAGELDEILGGNRVSITDVKPNLVIHFISVKEFDKYSPTRRVEFGATANLQFECDKMNNILRSQVLIADEMRQERTRKGSIRSLMTRALGFTSPLSKYPNGLFDTYYTTASMHYTELDRRLIRLLYREELRPGMRRSELSSVLAVLPRA